uniref:Zinc knuckle CX2CX4HX4C n=1 Tax=Tanacetum cinerariifolium TaxID=118510 RepID=A0A699HQK4_TANCI|nr:hypothetical protein [Tanacetum cinerariifolium]
MERRFLSPKEKGGEDTCPKNNVIGATCSSNNDSGNATYTQSDQNKGDATASVNVSTTDNETTADQDVAMTKNPIQLGTYHVGNTPVYVVPPLYATKLRLTSLTMANLRKLKANVPNDVDYDVWLPLDSVHEERSSYARILIEIEVCNDFSDNLVMDVPKFEGTKYTKETIRVEYEWKPPRCSTCLIFGHSLDDFQKAPKRVVNKMDKGKGGSSRADDEGFVEMLEGNSAIVDYDGRPLKKVDYSGDQNSEDETKSVDNEMINIWLQNRHGLDVVLRAC